MRAFYVLAASALALVVSAVRGGDAQVATSASTAPNSVTAPETYEVRLEGGDLALSGLYVLKTLADAKVLTIEDVELSKDTHTNVCAVFIEETNLPGGCTAGLINFANTINRFKESPNRLAVGTKVYYPKAEFEKYSYEKQYNLSAAADKVQLQDDKRQAGQYMSDAYTTSRSGQFIEHTFDAYKLKFSLPGNKATEDLIRRLNAYPGVFVVKQQAAPAPTKPPGYSVEFSAGQVPLFCTGNGTPEEPYSAKFNGATTLTQRDCAALPNGSCAEVVILDQPIAKNPEIDGVEGATGKQPVDKEPLCTDPELLGGLDQYHSTHMAGIIASKQNGKGFIGLHPKGKVVQGWASDGDVAENVRTRRTRDSLQVYLFARSWKLNSDWATGDRLNKAANRTEHIVGKRIHDLRESLWIVAAGQPSKNGLSQPTKIDDLLNLGPMNSGDQENVLVVGGCTECGSGQPRFWEQSHFSRQFVHVAAPADLIVSTATGGSHTWAKGTSQASAFVAGVVSALVSEWPNSYKFASRVKERLQYTATPFPDAADREKVASGVINPVLALKDPNKNYIDTTSTGDGLEEITLDGWCEESLTVVKPNGNLVENSTIVTDRIHRIVQVGSGANRQWSVFSDKPWDDIVPGFILHIGPGIPTAPTCTNVPRSARPLLKKGPKIYSLNEIEDLLVRTDLPRVSCGCPK